MLSGCVEGRPHPAQIPLLQTSLIDSLCFPHPSFIQAMIYKLTLDGERPVELGHLVYPSFIGKLWLLSPHQPGHSSQNCCHLPFFLLLSFSPFQVSNLHCSMRTLEGNFSSLAFYIVNPVID